MVRSTVKMSTRSCEFGDLVGERPLAKRSSLPVPTISWGIPSRLRFRRSSHAPRSQDSQQSRVPPMASHAAACLDRPHVRRIPGCASIAEGLSGVESTYVRLWAVEPGSFGCCRTPYRHQRLNCRSEFRRGEVAATGPSPLPGPRRRPVLTLELPAARGHRGNTSGKSPG